MVSTSLVLVSLSLFSGLAVSQTCKGNSCLIADVSGSTGRNFDGSQISKIPEVTTDGRRCIENAYLQLNLPIPRNYQPLTSIPSTYQPRPDWYVGEARKRSLRYGQSPASPLVAREPESAPELAPMLNPRQACTPKILVWARGTFDPPVSNNMGVIIGPALQSALESSQRGQWSAVGVEYTADLAGILCVGMLGGLACTKKLNQLGQQCPQSKFVVAGYSQGAMIAHECVAFVEKSVRDRVAAVVVFGDPFNGAPIRDYPAAKVKTYCDQGDGVCAGHLDIGLGHFAYAAGDSATQAARWIITQV